MFRSKYLDLQEVTLDPPAPHIATQALFGEVFRPKGGVNSHGVRALNG